VASRCGERVARASFWVCGNIAGLSAGLVVVGIVGMEAGVRWALAVAAVLVAVVAAVAGWLERGRARCQRENLRL
jgi:hypothetical protein